MFWILLKYVWNKCWVWHFETGSLLKLLGCPENCTWYPAGFINQIRGLVASDHRPAHPSCDHRESCEANIWKKPWLHANGHCHLAFESNSPQPSVRAGRLLVFVVSIYLQAFKAMQMGFFLLYPKMTCVKQEKVQEIEGFTAASICSCRFWAPARRNSLFNKFPHKKLKHASNWFPTFVFVAHTDVPITAICGHGNLFRRLTGKRPRSVQDTHKSRKRTNTVVIFFLSTFILLPGRKKQSQLCLLCWGLSWWKRGDRKFPQGNKSWLKKWISVTVYQEVGELIKHFYSVIWRCVGVCEKVLRWIDLFGAKQKLEQLFDALHCGRQERARMCVFVCVRTARGCAWQRRCCM